MVLSPRNKRLGRGRGRRLNHVNQVRRQSKDKSPQKKKQNFKKNFPNKTRCISRLHSGNLIFDTVLPVTVSLLLQK